MFAFACLPSQLIFVVPLTRRHDVVDSLRLPLDVSGINKLTREVEDGAKQVCLVDVLADSNRVSFS